MKALEVWTKFLADTSDYLAKVGGMETITEKFGNTLHKHSRKFMRSGLALAAGFGLAVKSAGDFENSMINMQSVAGATSEELDSLRKLALRIGKETPVSAKSAADAMYWLASAGQKATEMMSTLPGVTTLATATQDDLSHSTEVVISTLKAFQLDASETDRVVNSFAATIGASMANMDKLGESIKYVAPIAAQAGMSIEELNAILGTLYDLGLKGSMAGTALKSVMSGLLDPSSQFLEFLSGAGIAVSEVDPRLNDLADIFDRLKEKSFDVKDAMVSFGLRGAAATAFLASVGGDALRELEGKVTGTNRAYEMAEEQSKSFNNQMKMLWNNVNVLGIELGTTMLPMLKEWITNIKSVIGWFQRLTMGTKKFSMEVLGMTAALMIFLGQLGRMAPMLGAAAGPLGLIIILLYGIATAYSWTSNKILDYNRQLKDASEEEAKSIKRKKALLVTLKTTSFGLAGLIANIGTAREQLTGTATETEAGLRALKQAAKEEAEMYWEMHLQMIAAEDQVKMYFDEVQAQMSETMKKVPVWQRQMLTFISTLSDKISTGVKMELVFEEPKIGGPMEKVVETVTEAMEEVGDQIQLLPVYFSQAGDATLGFMDAFKNNMYNLFREAFVENPQAAAAHFLSLTENVVQQVLAGQKELGTALLEISTMFLTETLKMVVKAELQELLASKISTIGKALMKGTIDWTALGMIPLILAAYATASAALGAITLHEGGMGVGGGEYLARLQSGEVTLDRSLTAELGEFLSAQRGDTYKTTMHNTFHISKDVDIHLLERKLASLQRSRWSRKE